MLGNFSWFCWLVLIFYFFSSELTVSKNSFMNTIRVSNSLDPDQGPRSVGPDLGPNCLQRLSARANSECAFYAFYAYIWEV